MAKLVNPPQPLDYAMLNEVLMAKPELARLIALTYERRQALLHPMRIEAETEEDYRNALEVYNRTLYWVGEKLGISYRLLEYAYRHRLHYLRIPRKPEMRDALEGTLVALTDRPVSECFFSIREVAAVMRNAIRTEVITVAVPLSLFSSNPDAFRAEFRNELDLKVRTSGVRKSDFWGSRMPPLSEWTCVSRFKPEERLLIGSLQEDLERYASMHCLKRTEDALAKLPAYEVPLPGKLTLPEMKTLVGTAQELVNSDRCPMGMRAVRRFGWARHTFDYPDKVTGSPQQMYRYSPGLALGEKKNWADYDINAVAPVAWDRAKAFFGEEFLLRHWNFRAANCLCYDGGGRD